MTLDNIEIVNFKNIASASLEFSPGVNCLLGNNGMGKSNLLEAIHFMSMARAMSPMPESGLIRHGEEMLLIKGHYTMDAGNGEDVSCGIVKGKGKTLKRNGKEYTRISEHIGSFPIVTVTPQDWSLVGGAAEERRKLMDVVISQANSAYLTNLIKYTRSLESRNRMLRAGVRDALLFESVEASMCEAADAVFEARKEWIAEIAPVFRDCYRRLAGEAESATMRYKSVMQEAPLQEILDNRRAKDIVLGYTSQGIHRDDIETGLDGYSMRRLGSQGQIKTFTIALRLAIFRYLKEHRHVTPLLLLDDIFDKLDADRVARIMETVTSDSSFGQIFITDTNRKHLDDILKAINGPKLLLEVSDGTFTPIYSESSESKENGENSGS